MLLSQSHKSAWSLWIPPLLQTAPDCVGPSNRPTSSPDIYLKIMLKPDSFSYFPERLEHVSSNCSLQHLGNVDSSSCCLSGSPLSVGLYQKLLSSRRCPTESCPLSEMQFHPGLTLTHYGGRRNQWFCCIATMMYITPLPRLCCSFWPRHSAGRYRPVGPQLYCYIWCSLSLCYSPQLVAWQLSALGNLIRLCAKAVQLLAVPWRVVS